MTLSRVLLAGGLLLAALPAGAVYAPVPTPEHEKTLVVSLKSGLTYDTNLFGGSAKNVESSVFEFTPRVAYNASLTSQTFASASYQPTISHFDNRPGDKTLDSHEATARIAHAFAASTTLDVLGLFMVTRNPESLLNGLPLNADQSNNRAELDLNFSTAPTAKSAVTVKARTVNSDYRDAALGRSLDRLENLLSVSGSYAVLPEVKSVAEFRHQDVFYAKLGESKNKHSNYVMGGIDYALAKKLSVSARAGAEWRRRSSEENSTGPYAELTARYTYAEDSFLAGGFMYTIEETSDTTRFNDSKLGRTFLSVQHHLTALIVASGSLTYEAAELQGRRTQANVEEETTRAGVSLTYLPSKNWAIAASYDTDLVSSAESSREMTRHRVGLSASYSF